jgi:hypothetical protein
MTYSISYKDASPIYVAQEHRADRDVALSRAQQISHDNPYSWVEVWLENDEGTRTNLVAQYINGAIYERKS